MKIAIVGGAGGIGSSLGFNLLRMDLDAEVVLIDTRPNMITSHTMDLEDIVALGGGRGVRAGDASECLDADVVAVSASVPLRLNSSRLEFLGENAQILSGIVAPLGNGFEGVVIVMTNPTDPLVTWTVEATGLDPSRVLGYSLNDTLRFRFGVAKALDVHPRRISALVIGEHGEHQLPMYRTLTLDGEPLQLTPEQRYVAQEYVDTWYTRHVALDSGRTSTWSSGLGTALMIEAMATRSPVPFPTSVVLSGEYGVDGVALTVPALLGPTGVDEVVELDLIHEEREQMQSAAAHVRDAKEGIVELLSQHA